MVRPKACWNRSAAAASRLAEPLSTTVAAQRRPLRSEGLGPRRKPPSPTGTVGPAAGEVSMGAHRSTSWWMRPRFSGALAVAISRALIH